jgi:hypothetical protein
VNKKIAAICFLLFFACYGFAQTSVEGVVVNAAGEKIEGAIVSLTDGNQDILTYKISDREGKFSLSVEQENTGLRLVASLLGYATQTIALEKTSQNLKIVLQPQAIEIQEVVVKADMIRRREDTIVYNVDAFKAKQDRVIGDIIQKLPGVEVSDNGTISYNGESINKFYIEGMDLLEGKYGIATNNVPVDAVQNVELIENHEPLNLLKDISTSTRAAINLKLKNSKLAKPVGNATLGAGADENDFLWRINLFLLQAGSRQQTIAMYKTNNTGVNVSRELTDLITGNTYPLQTSVFNDNLTSSLRLSSQRYLFNQTHTASVNHLFKIGKNDFFRMNINYLHDRQDKRIETNSSYFLQDSMLNINELTLNNQKSNALDASLTYTNNAPSFYLNNLLNAKLQWNSALAGVTAQNHVAQQYLTPEYNISNSLQLIRKFGNRLFDITSNTYCSSLPQELNIGIDSLENIYNQSVRYAGFYSNLSTALSFIGENSALTLRLTAEGALENFHSRLSHELFTDSTVNDMRSSYFTLNLTPTYKYDLDKITFSFIPRIQQHFINISDRPYQKDLKKAYLFVQPRLTVSYSINPFWSATLGYGFNQSVGDMMDLTVSPVLYSYRNIRIKSGVLSHRKTQSASVRLNFRNPLTTLFFNTGLQYSNTRRNLLNNQRFIGINSISGNLERENRTESWMWMVYAGKYLRDVRTNISLQANVSYNRSEKLQQDILYPVQSLGVFLTPKINVKISDAMNAEYRASIISQHVGIETSDNTTRNRSGQVSQNLNYYYFINNWELSVQGEYLYSQIARNVSAGTFFADVRLKYAAKFADFELSWNNIFNNRSYKYIIYSDLDTYIYNYRLRPSNILFSVSFRY